MNAKVGFFQFESKFGDVNYNLDRINKNLKNRKIDLLVLPELYTTGYMFKNKKELKEYCEKIPSGKTVKKLKEICQKYKLYVVCGLPEIKNNKLYNSCVLIGPKGYIGKYQKAHLFYKEKNFFDKGDVNYKVFKTDIGNIGLMICFDYMFPEVVRTLALKGADIVCNPCCLKTKPEKVMTCMRSRALENGIFTITVNKVGKERNVQFIGESEIIDPRMNLLTKGSNTEDIKIKNIDVSKARNKNYNKYNNLIKDRRKELYKL